jgi:hypothetical protein
MNTSTVDLNRFCSLIVVLTVEAVVYTGSDSLPMCDSTV